MKEKRILVAVGALSAALAACSSEVTDPGAATGGGSGTGTSGTGNGSGAPGNGGSGQTPGAGGTAVGTAGTGTTNPGAGGSPVGSSGGSSGAPSNPGVCVQGIPATTQIPRLLNRQYDAVVRDLLGVTTLGTDNQPPSASLFADFDGPMNDQSWAIYQDVGAKIAAQVMGGANKSKFISCDPAATGCMAQTIQTFGRKAFRRALTAAEVQRFQKLGQTTPAGTPAQIAETTLLAFLISPSFLLLPELNAVPEGTAIKLSSAEVATRLSFMLWGSIPDDMLNAAADADQLQTKEQILAQAKRMIDVHEKTGPLVASYHRRYVDMDNPNQHWWKIASARTADPTVATKLPLYSPASVPAMQAELDAFFQDVTFGNGTFKDLFLSNIGYVTKDTAPLYGLDPAAYGTQLTRVELDATQRPGFLTRVGFLSSFAHTTSTSPILRGAYITVNLIGVNPGPPDPEALQKTVTGNFKTEREYVETLTGDGACKTCHTPFVNPPGFALENFDAIGKWQTTDPRGGPINSSATVTFSADNIKTISSPLELMKEIGTGELARRIYAEKWVSFATGRQPNSNDACTVNDLDTKLSKDGYTVLNLLQDLTQTDSFRLRVRGN
jgi:hypothetical protein